MEALIDDVLKNEEADKFQAGVSNDALNQAFENYAANLSIDTEQLETQLKEAGIEKNTLLSQMGGNLAWSAVVQGLLRPMVNVTDDEVVNFLEKMERDRGKTQYRLREVFILLTDNARRDEIIETANLLTERLREGAPFDPIAQQFSQSSTAAVGGDLGWVMTDELSSEFAEIVPNMEVGQVSNPIETEDGYYILRLDDTAQVLMLNNSDIAVNLKFILFEEENGLSIEELNNRFYSSLSQTDTCEMAEEKAAEFGGTFGDIGMVRLGAVRRELHDKILALEIGAGTDFQEDDAGYRSMILCDKNIPEVQIPDFDAVLQNITQTRLQLVAKRHLRDLRRDAIVDYR